MSGHLFQNSNGKSRCSATRRNGFSQGKYKGNGSSLVICFKGADPLRRVCSANGPIGRPAAARLLCRLSIMDDVFSISDRPTKSFSISVLPQKGRVPFPIWDPFGKSPCNTRDGFILCFFFYIFSRNRLFYPNRYRRVLRWPCYCVCHRSCLWDTDNTLDVFFRFIPDGLCLNT